MNLIIDVGNTLVKFAVFKSNSLIFKESFRVRSLTSRFKKILEEFPEIEKGIVSSVGRLKDDDLELLDKRLQLTVLDSKTKLPFNNNYKTPTTLGVDRIALVSASVLDFSNKNVLIIDAGTCITYDFINSENNYLGGAISPGIRMRYKALNNLTEKLPLIDTTRPKGITGDTTEESIHSGVVYGVLLEIDGVIDNYRAQYSDLTVILTGGDSKFLSNQLKNSIFANSNFLLEGLNYILEFNFK